MKHAFQFQIVLLFSLASFWVKADTRWYQVEAIVFEQNTPSTEVFEQTVSELQLSGNPAYLSESRYSISRLKQNPVAYARVSSDGMLLHGTYNKLNRSNQYDPLLHVSWVQPASSNRVNRGVYLELIGQNGQELLSGVVKIQRGHYLHLITDMEFAPGDYSHVGGFEFSEPVIYRLNEKRRFKLNEVHYLDHPRFGIIFKVSLLE